MWSVFIIMLKISMLCYYNKNNIKKIEMGIAKKIVFWRGCSKNNVFKGQFCHIWDYEQFLTVKIVNPNIYPYWYFVVVVVVKPFDNVTYTYSIVTNM